MRKFSKEKCCPEKNVANNITKKEIPEKCPKKNVKKKNNEISNSSISKASYRLNELIDEFKDNKSRLNKTIDSKISFDDSPKVYMQTNYLEKKLSIETVQQTNLQLNQLHDDYYLSEI